MRVFFSYECVFEPSLKKLSEICRFFVGGNGLDFRPSGIEAGTCEQDE